MNSSLKKPKFSESSQWPICTHICCLFPDRKRQPADKFEGCG